MQQARPAGGDSRNNPWLDLVRAIAILLVLLRHGERALQAANGDTRGALETFFINGWVGVDLFFVLSGYLITRHLLGAGLGSGRFRFGRYIAIRALRIVPAYLAVLALILAGAFPFYRFFEPALPFRVAYHLLFLQDYLPSNINVVFWSLGVEEKFYLLAPLVAILLLRARLISVQVVLLAGLFLLPLIFRTWSFLHLPGEIAYDQFFRIFRSPFHMTTEGLVVGMGIAVIQHGGLLRHARKAGLIAFSLAGIALVLWLGSHDFMASIDMFDAVAQPSLIALLAGLMTLGAVQLAGTAMPFQGPVRLVARLSYCLYLIHYPLIPLIVALAAHQGTLLFWACYMAGAFIAAWLLHVAVERPFLIWKDRLARENRAGLTEADLNADKALRSL